LDGVGIGNVLAYCADAGPVNKGVAALLCIKLRDVGLFAANHRKMLDEVNIYYLQASTLCLKMPVSIIT